MRFHIQHHAPLMRGLRSSGVRSFHSSPQSHLASNIHRPKSRAAAKRSSSSGSRSRCHSGCSCHPAAAAASAAAAVSQTNTAYIALGSNLGDRISEIEKACNEMSRRGIRVKRTSSLWETEPMYVTEQDRFINGACECIVASAAAIAKRLTIADPYVSPQVETELEPLGLLDELQAIERDMGRNKVIDKGPRNIDLDILLYGDEKVHNDRLNVPHIGIPEREFVLRPLAELIPSKPLYASQPWKLVQDYLNDLAPGEPLSSITPMSRALAPLTPLVRNRKTSVMGILNMTPDSFSDGGRNSLETLSNTVRDLVRNGASIIDVGGQSTAPGRPQVSAEEETSRVVPAIELIRSMPETRHVAISVDTYRASVAEKAIASGADIINDVSAGALDAEMLPTVGRLGKTICLMHMRGTPQTMAQLTSYPEGLVPTVAAELLERVAAAEAAGIRRWRIILDPGIGFAKTGAQNLELLRSLEELREWPGLQGLPWLVGTSRKSFIGKVTGVDEASQRVWGTAATVAAAVQGGADVIRVHDVREMALVTTMSDAIWRA